MNVVRRYVHGGPRTRKGTTSARLPRHLHTVLLSTYERAPKDFETLLGLEGVGARTLRALALVSEVIYDTPFPVDRATYDRTVDTLHRAMAHAKVDRSDKVDALKRLGRFAKSTEPDSNNLH